MSGRLRLALPVHYGQARPHPPGVAAVRYQLLDAHRWVLAAQGVLIRRNKMEFDLVGGMERPGYSFVSTRMLARDWGILTVADARARLDWLEQEGHRHAYPGRIAPAELLGWDLVRLIAVAGWAYHAYLIDLEDAWGRMLRGARALQAAYPSWEAIAESYLRGYTVHFGEDEEAVSLREEVVRDLLVDPSSPWVELPFATPLGPAAVPPVVVQATRVVDAGGGGDFATLKEALEAAEAGDRIVVRPGVYRERIDIVTPVEIVGEEGACIETSEACCLFVKKSAATVQGLRFRSGTSQAGQAMHAVIVHGFFLKMIDCDVASARAGVYLTNGDAYASLEGTRIHEAATAGVLVEGGTLIVRGGEVSGTKAASIQLGACTARIDGVTCRGAEQTAVLCLAGVDLEVRDARLRENAAGIDVTGGARAIVLSSEIVANRGGGARAFGPSSALHLAGCRVADNGAINLGAVQSTEVLATDCEIVGGDCAAWADHGAIVRLQGCRVGLGAEGVVREMNGGRVIIEASATDLQPEA
jgi:hypothetical protein